jgi:hypothetical protein
VLRRFLARFLQRHYNTTPRPHLLFTERPRPDCPGCDGYGYIDVASGRAPEDPDQVDCDCYDPTRVVFRVPLPGFLARPAARLVGPPPF